MISAGEPPISASTTDPPVSTPCASSCAVAAPPRNASEPLPARARLVETPGAGPQRDQRAGDQAQAVGHRVAHLRQQQHGHEEAPRRVLRDQAHGHRTHPAPPAQAAAQHADGRRAEDHEHDEGGEPRVVAVEEPVPEHPGEGTRDEGRGHHDDGDAAGRAADVARPAGRDGTG